MYFFLKSLTFIFVMPYLKSNLKKLNISFILGIITIICGYLVKTILARKMDLADFGLVMILISGIDFLTVFTNFGFGATQVKYIAHYLELKSPKKVFSTIVYSVSFRLFANFLLTILIFIFSSILLVKYFKTDDFILIWFLVWGLLITTIFNIISRLFMGFHKSITTNFMTLLQNILFLFPVLLIFFYDVPRNLVILMYLVSIFLTFMVVLPKLWKLIPKNQGLFVDKKFIKTLFGFAFASFMIQAGMITTEYTSTIMLTLMGGLKDIAVFSIVSSSSMAMLFIGKTINTILFPLTSKFWARKNYKKINESFMLINKYVLVVTSILIVMVLVFPEFLLQTFFGESFLVGTNSLRVMAIGVFFLNLAFIYQSVLSGTSSVKSVSNSVFVGAIINIVLSFLLIPHFKITGAALSASISFFVMFLMNLYSLREYVNIKSEVWLLVRFVLIMCLLVLGGVFGINKGYFWIVFTIIPIVYVLILFGTKIITWKEIIYFKKLMK